MTMAIRKLFFRIVCCVVIVNIVNGKPLEKTLLENEVEIDSIDEGVHELPSTVEAGGNTFNIVLGYGTSATSAEKEGFSFARSKWQSVINNDTSSRTCFRAGSSQCGFRFKHKTCFDDLFIGIRIQPIDGPGGV